MVLHLNALLLVVTEDLFLLHKSRKYDYFFSINRPFTVKKYIISPILLSNYPISPFFYNNITAGTTHRHSCSRRKRWVYFLSLLST